ncbi:PREDICTED: tetratricopeptide repeat protein 28-like [Acropora digitifera]|uniref:tetratricopeptide repeat protein 28-like n=1 Tax=Acropora digitifera TaxID=70779 RepID=UPI00077AA937|nr:PREDICTED: tetratricopeptide repeat protein 28-like [Acropora digitifera]
MDDQAGKGGAYANRKRAFHLPAEFQEEIEHNTKDLNIAKEIDYRAGEGRGCADLSNAYPSMGDFRKAIEYTGNLGNTFQKQGDFRKAIEYHEKRLNIAIEMDDRAGEATAYSNLGNAYHSLSDFRKAIEHDEKSLTIAKEIGDRKAEGLAYGNIGVAYQLLGDYRQAIMNHKRDLNIAKDIGSPEGQARAYSNLGQAYHSLSDFRKAIEHDEKSLTIAKEIGDRKAEGLAYGNIGVAYQLLGDYRQAIMNHKRDLNIAKDIGSPEGQARAYSNLGQAYHSLSDFRKAIEHDEKSLTIAKEIGDRKAEGLAYGNIGVAYQLLGDYRQAIMNHKRDLNIAKDIGSPEGQARAYSNLGNAYHSLSDYQKAIEYHEKAKEIAKEIGHQITEAGAYANLGNAYQLLGDFQEAIKYYEKHFNTAIEIGYRAGEGVAYINLGAAYKSQGNIVKAIEYFEKGLHLLMEIDDRITVGIAYENLGDSYRLLGNFLEAIEIIISNRDKEGGAYTNFQSGHFSCPQFGKAVEYFLSAVKVFNTLRSLLKCEYGMKMSFRERHENSFTALWRSLLKLRKVDEALSAAEQGRAQTLSDNLLIQYKIAPPSSVATDSIDSKETIIGILSKQSTKMIFLAIEKLKINIWFLSRGRNVEFRHTELQGDGRGTDPISALVESALETINPGDRVICENRSLDKLTADCPSSRGDEDNPPQPSKNSLKPFHDAVIGPICDMLGPQDDELVIVPDGALNFIPWAAVVESIRIRSVPSLTSYHLILSVPEGYHKKTGALLVGNPYLEQLEEPLENLPFAQKEVEMIATILNTRPLTGGQATKAEVMKRIPAVGLIHIAAHGDKTTGQIALSPNPGWTSQFPKKEDYILKISDVQAANLRASLVVLSCCHSGRGKILKGEGVVGIARDRTSYYSRVTTAE